MKKNVGGIDRIMRLAAGLAIIILGIVFQSWWGLIGIVPIFTAAINWCPLYMPFGLSTCKTNKRKK
ncbi:MAG: hypothetical protein FD143_1081 [Ignavibacteria bacterium]|nr:MAG: hypothetical protein FD143_1081 [Ignavibacteria bacterium]KAF0161012.1 MAG: hypothetical protein FD188_1233 [Ignavibacteria bacterium]